MIAFETVKEFKEAVGNAQWDINYAEFCQRAGFTMDSYAQSKWTQFQEAARGLAQFDDTTFAKILGVTDA